MPLIILILFINGWNCYQNPPKPLQFFQFPPIKPKRHHVNVILVSKGMAARWKEAKKAAKETMEEKETRIERSVACDRHTDVSLSSPRAYRTPPLASPSTRRDVCPSQRTESESWELHACSARPVRPLTRRSFLLLAVCSVCCLVRPLEASQAVKVAISLGVSQHVWAPFFQPLPLPAPILICRQT